jgi:flagellin-like hook-associated protein FlgL
MAINDISLTPGIRKNLLNLQQTASLMARTQDRLSTGRKVNSPIDDPIAFFAAQGHNQRAADLSLRKDGMSEGIQAITAANNGLDAINSLVQQLKGIVTAARTSTTAGLDLLRSQFNGVLSQINFLTEDAVYKGTNLLTAGTLTVEFNEDGSSYLTVSGFDATASGLSLYQLTAANFATTTNFNSVADVLDTASDTIKTQTQRMSTNLNIITTRQDFTDNMINTLIEGADNLTLADMNEESANILMLQTRQQLGISALSMATEEAQMILSLF